MCLSHCEIVSLAHEKGMVKYWHVKYCTGMGFYITYERFMRVLKIIGSELCDITMARGGELCNQIKELHMLHSNTSWKDKDKERQLEENHPAMLHEQLSEVMTPAVG